MAGTVLEYLTLEDAEITLEIAEIYCNLAIAELPALRRAGNIMLMRILTILKNRSHNSSPNKFKLQAPRDIVWTENLLKQFMLPLTESSIDQYPLIDDEQVGWLAWPQEIKAYKVGETAPPINPKDKPVFEYLLSKFTSPEYLQKVIDYSSQEQSSGARSHETFGISTVIFYKSFAQMFGMSFFNAVQPMLVSLAQAADSKSKQRAAAELCAGLVRGTKHWSLNDLDHFWKFLIPALTAAFDATTPDTLGFWEQFVKVSLDKRDPRRLYPLIQLVTNFSLTGEESFAESKKLYICRSALLAGSWRLNLLARSLLPKFLSFIAHPYQLVREMLGSNINQCLQLLHHPSAVSVSDLISANSQSNNLSGVPTELEGDVMELVKDVVTKLKMYKAEHVPAAQGASDYSNACRTVLSWFGEGLRYYRSAGVYPVVPILLPEIFAIQDTDDPDLQQIATQVVNFTGHFMYTIPMEPVMIQTLLKVLGSENSWHVRIKVLPVLQVLFFRNLFLLPTSLMAVVVDQVLGLLTDSQLEVRHLAAVTLAGLIRCSQRDVIEMLKKHSSEYLKVTLPKRSRDGSRSVLPAGFNEAVLKRHAGVLGLSCIVQAFPYEVPTFLPDVLVQLADFLSDPVPISTTVKNTFADFKRTHQDTWHEDSQKFTEDQLYLLSDLLISPSYYA